MIGPPLADAEHDGPARLGKRVAELAVLRWRIEPLGVAPVLFDVIHAPLGVRARVEFLEAVGAGPALARLASRVRVDAELETLGVHVVGERLHAAREADRIGDDTAGPVARHLPAVVDHDVPIAGVAHAARHDRVRGLLNKLGADVAAEMVPAVPARGRSAGEAVVEWVPGRRAAAYDGHAEADEYRGACRHAGVRYGGAA